MHIIFQMDTTFFNKKKLIIIDLLYLSKSIILTIEKIIN